MSIRFVNEIHFVLNLNRNKRRKKHRKAPRNTYFNAAPELKMNLEVAPKISINVSDII